MIATTTPAAPATATATTLVVGFGLFYVVECLKCPGGLKKMIKIAYLSKKLRLLKKNLKKMPAMGSSEHSNFTSMNGALLSERKPVLK